MHRARREIGEARQAVELLTMGEAMQYSEVEDSIVAYLRGKSGHMPSVQIDGATPLLGSAILDSLGILELMMFLSESFDIEIEDLDFDPSNFESVSHLATFVRQKKNVLA
jgi:acyl carrier protein